MTGLYIHIPFCSHRCSYCDFPIHVDPYGRLHEQYMDALCHEISHLQPATELQTIYIGGGTPSLLSEELFSQMLACIHRHCTVAPDAEITLELNPNTITPAKINHLHRLGINRCSVGVQSSDPQMLRRLGRIYDLQVVRDCIDTISAAGIDNISVDLIYGLPHSTLADWQRCLDDVLTLQPQHISCYALSVEPNTFYGRRYTHTQALDELAHEQYTLSNQLLASHGYEHYEISNYAMPERQSKHNLLYWTMGEYYAVGMAAHGYVGGRRYEHTDDIHAYIADPCGTQELDCNPATETLMLGLRMGGGIDIDAYQSTYNNPLNLDQIDRFGGLVYVRDGRLRLTEQGMFVSNYIIAELLR